MELLFLFQRANAELLMSRREPITALTELSHFLGSRHRGFMGMASTLGDKVLGTCSVSQAIGGMRSVKSMIYETSLLDPLEGIRFRGFTIPELQQKLPTAVDGTIGKREPIPEAILWLLLTGEVPTEAEVRQLTAELQKRSKILPAHVEQIIRALPRDMHPMTKLSMAVLACQTESEFGTRTPASPCPRRSSGIRA